MTYQLHYKQEEVLNKVISLLENNDLTWLKSWTNGSFKNYLTKRNYKGMNTLILNMNNCLQGFKSPYYLTFLQVKKLNGSVRAGSKGTTIFFYEIRIEEKINEDTGEKEERRKPILRCYNVFNLEQTNIKIPEEENKPELKPLEKAEQLILNFKDKPEIKEGFNPCYIPPKDIVEIPNKNKFVGIEEYYSVLFHEFSHSTGHNTRLKREGVTNVDLFGSNQYSKEEVIAELSTCFLCSKIGIENNTLNNSAGYIQSWLKNMKEDKTFLFKVVREAQKSADFITGETK
jgi:antirestriction protein ArdC